MGERGRDGEHSEQFFAGLERLAWMLRIAGADPIEQERRLLAVIKDIDACEMPDDMRALNVRARHLSAANTNLRSRTFYSKHYCGAILKLLSLRLGAVHHLRETDRAVCTIEHVLPRNPSIDSQWRKDFPSPQLISDHANRLGNLVLLSHADNQSVGTREFGEKRHVFEASDEVLAKAVARDYQHWTPDAIMERTEKLIDVLFNDWRLNAD